MERRPHVVVLGGGPAGAVAAWVLAQAGAGVTVYDSRPGPMEKVGETLPPSVLPLLDKLGLTALCNAPPHTRSHGNRACWGSDELRENHFLFSPHGTGWHLDRRCFELQLCEHVERAGAQWRWNHHALEAVQHGQAWTLRVEAASELTSVEADWVIDATGRSARLTRGLNVRRRYYDRLIGIACVLPMPRSSFEEREQLTLVEATPQGWWYTALLSGGRRVAVCIADGDQIDVKVARTARGWQELMQQAPHVHRSLAPWLAEPSRLPAPRALPAGSACSVSFCGRGWIAVGDAAMSFDPLASFGIASAMTTGYYGGCAVIELLSGAAEAAEAYTELVRGMFSRYLAALRERYAAERRFEGEPFWLRRHAPAQ